MRKSPYLSSDSRLGDVIAAIQAMGTYRFYKLNFSEWSDRISGDPSNREYWKNIFIEHPEFFRLDSERKKASLVVRRQHPKLFDVDKGSIVTKDYRENLSAKDKERISRSPLSSEEISSLINVAIEMHARAADSNRDARWWLPVLTAGIASISGIAGALIGLYVNK